MREVNATNAITPNTKEVKLAAKNLSLSHPMHVTFIHLVTFIVERLCCDRDGLNRVDIHISNVS